MKRSRNVWTADAEEVLLMLWEQNIEQIRGPRKNMHIYHEMAAEMQAQGYAIDAPSIKTKLDNSTAKYRRTNNVMGTTGASPPSWHMYEQVHRIIGGLTIHNLELIVRESYEAPRSPSLSHNSSLPASMSQPSPLSSPSPSSSSPSLPSPSSLASSSPPPASSASSSRAASADKSAKKKQVDRLVMVCEEMNKHFAEGMGHFTKSTQELVELEKSKLATMKELQGDAKRLTDGVLDFLNRF